MGMSGLLYDLYGFLTYLLRAADPPIEDFERNARLFRAYVRLCRVYSQTPEERIFIQGA